MANTTEFFFERLNYLLKMRNSSQSELSSKLTRTDETGNKKQFSPRYIEVCKRNGTLPDLDTVLQICSILQTNITFFTDQTDTKLFSEPDCSATESDCDDNTTEICFPSSCSNLVNQLPRERLSSFLETSVFTNLPMYCDIYIYANEKSKQFYSRFFYDEIFNYLKKNFSSVENRKSFCGILFSLHIPAFVTVTDILNDDKVIDCTEQELDRSSRIQEMYDECLNDFLVFQRKIFSSFGTVFLSKIKLNIIKSDMSSTEFDRGESALLINNKFAYFTCGKNLIKINERGNESVYLKKLTKDYEVGSVTIKKSDFTVEKQLCKALGYYFNGELSKSDLMVELKDKKNVSILRKLLSHIVITGLPGVGKSTYVQRLYNFFESANLESSDYYINYRVFDDNRCFFSDGYDTRESFKKMSQNSDLYLDIRLNTVLSTIDKALGRKVIPDLGAKEIFYDDVYFKILHENFKIIHLVYADLKSNSNTYDDYFKDYLTYLRKDPERPLDEKIVDKDKRHNLWMAALTEDGTIDLNSEKFEKFIRRLFDKRFTGYKKRCHYTVIRTPLDSKEDVLFKIIFTVLEGCINEIQF